MVHFVEVSFFICVYIGVAGCFGECFKAFVGLAGLVGDFLVGVGAVVKSILLDGVDHIVGGGAGFALERVR